MYQTTVGADRSISSRSSKVNFFLYLLSLLFAMTPLLFFLYFRGAHGFAEEPAGFLCKQGEPLFARLYENRGGIHILFCELPLYFTRFSAKMQEIFTKKRKKKENFLSNISKVCPKGRRWSRRSQQTIQNARKRENPLDSPGKIAKNRNHSGGTGRERKCQGKGFISVSSIQLYHMGPVCQ